LFVTTKRFFSLSDVLAVFTAINIDLNVGLLIFWKIVLVIDRFDWALGDTSFAVNTLIGMNVKHGFAFIETLYWANHNAIGVSATVTWFSNDVCHELSLLSNNVS
jgi:hypothetical protein